MTNSCGPHRMSSFCTSYKQGRIYRWKALGTCQSGDPYRKQRTENTDSDSSFHLLSLFWKAIRSAVCGYICMHSSFTSHARTSIHETWYIQRKIVSSGLLRRVALVRRNVSEELSASFIRVTRIGELGITLAVTSNRRTLRTNTKFLRNVGYYKRHAA
jgi:hypothetical protein